MNPQDYISLARLLMATNPRRSQNIIDVTNFPPKTNPRVGGPYFYDPKEGRYFDYSSPLFAESLAKKRAGPWGPSGPKWRDRPEFDK